MTPHRQLLDDLRGEFRGSLHVDAATRALYATDASPFALTPHAVAVPVDEDDLRTLVRYAHEHALPLVPRGAGSGVAGESLGPGVVVDLSVHFRQVVSTSEQTVRAQCGVVLSELNGELAKIGRRFAPDPASGRVCTIGGMIGTNASGANVSAHGYTREHTAGLRVMWDSGESAEVSGVHSAAAAAATPQLRTIEIRSAVAALLSEQHEPIQRARPHTPYTRFGYAVHDVLTPAGTDLTRLLVGSEGTLAVVTEAELRTIPTAGGVSSVVFGFLSVQEAVRAGLTLGGTAGVVAADVYDQRLLSLVKQGGEPIGVPSDIAAVLVATFEGDSAEAAVRAARDATARLGDLFAAAILFGPTATADARRGVDAFRAAVDLVTYSTGTSGITPTAVVDDTAVPGEDLLRYLSGITEQLRHSELPAILHVQPLVGRVNVRPLVDPRRPADRSALWPLADRIHSLAIAVGGTVSSRHGTGLTRTPWIAKQFPTLLPVFAELKRIFDPKGILNPGKITAPDPSRPAWPLRDTGEPKPTRTPLLVWAGTTPDAEAGRCNGCGDCRERTPPVRMCPTFHGLRTEVATPRAKANLFQWLTAARPDEVELLDRVRDIAGTCVNCKMCRTECPSRVDIPTLALEAKAEHTAAQGLDRDQWMQARLDGIVRFARLLPMTANLVLGTRVGRWLIEKLIGVSRQRMLPRVLWRPFLSRAKRAGWTTRPKVSTATRKVAFFVDLFVNQADPTVGEAAVAVLRHHGVEVVVPHRQRVSGATAVAQGDLDFARDLALQNVRLFAEFVRDGYAVVAAEPTAVVTIRQDYPLILDDPDVPLLAANTTELTDYLWRMHEAGELRTDFAKPLELAVGHHVPCHVKALGEPAGPKLLALIPGVTVTTIDRSCSGMAGTYGLKASAFEASLRAGRPMLDALNDPAVRTGSTECGSCRLQMQEGSGRRTFHPVQYLAYAYGLMPRLERRLTRPLGRLVTD